jgi:hypothetical protein
VKPCVTGDTPVRYAAPANENKLRTPEERRAPFPLMLAGFLALL